MKLAGLNANTLHVMKDKMDSSCNGDECWSTPDQGIYVSSYEEVYKVIKEYESDTMSKFIIRKVDKELGSKGQ